MTIPAPKLRGAVWDLDGTKFRYAAHTREALVDATARAAHNVLTNYNAAQPVPDMAALAQRGLESFLACGVGTAFLAEYGIPEAVSHAAYHSLCPADIIEHAPELSVAFAQVAHKLEHVIYTHAHESWARTALDIQHLSPFYPDERIVSLEKINFARKDRVADGFHHCANILQLPLTQLAMIEDSPHCLRIPKELGMVTILVRDSATLAETQTRHPHIDYVVDDATAACRLLHRLTL